MILKLVQHLKRLGERASPRPWAIGTGRSSAWFVADANGQVAFDDGTAWGEYGPECSGWTRDYIIEAVNALPEIIEAYREAVEVVHEYGGADMCIPDERYFRVMDRAKELGL